MSSAVGTEEVREAAKGGPSLRIVCTLRWSSQTRRHVPGMAGVAEDGRRAGRSQRKAIAYTGGQGNVQRTVALRPADRRRPPYAIRAGAGSSGVARIRARPVPRPGAPAPPARPAPSPGPGDADGPAPRGGPGRERSRRLVSVRGHLTETGGPAPSRASF